MTIFQKKNTLDVIDIHTESEKERKLRILTHIIYGLYAFFWLTGGVSAVIAIIINYVKHADTVGTLYESHFSWQIRSFWWAIAWAALGCLLILALIGFAILWIVAIWALYRIIKGWIYLYDHKAMTR